MKRKLGQYEYRILRSDRTRSRIVDADTALEAVRLVAGKYFYSARLDSWAEDELSGTYRVTLLAGSKDKTGGQPVVERTFYVETA